MATTHQVIQNIVSISDFSHGQASRIFGRIANEVPVTVLKNNRPVAMICTPEDYARFNELEEDNYLLQMALSRLENQKDEKPLTQQDIMRRYAITQSELDAIPDEDIEFE
jgi:PHD/YefM family antitoxin component YafN of YafNO toxin-antitoxin module